MKNSFLSRREFLRSLTLGSLALPLLISCSEETDKRGLMRSNAEAAKEFDQVIDQFGEFTLKQPDDEGYFTIPDIAMGPESSKQISHVYKKYTVKGVVIPVVIPVNYEKKSSLFKIVKRNEQDYPLEAGNIIFTDSRNFCSLTNKKLVEEFRYRHELLKSKYVRRG